MDDSVTQAPRIWHATTVAVGARGALILGPSGAGKSGLALRLMALGARLVADDRTLLTRVGDRVMAACPPGIAGRIEARGLGILHADAVGPVALALAIDLSRSETARLPEPRHLTVEGLAIPLVYSVAAPHFEAALMQLLKAGRAD